MLPTRPSQSTEINGEALDAEEFVEYARLRGQTQYEVVKSIIESDWYSSLSDEDRAGMISDAYSYATAAAKNAVRPEYAMSSWAANAKAAQEECGLPVVAPAPICDPACYFVHIGGNCGLDKETNAFAGKVLQPTEVVLNNQEARDFGDMSIDQRCGLWPAA